jgi:hypothetical protein
MAAMTCKSVKGAKMITRVLWERSKQHNLRDMEVATYGELPSAPVNE